MARPPKLRLVPPGRRRAVEQEPVLAEERSSSPPLEREGPVRSGTGPKGHGRADLSALADEALVALADQGDSRAAETLYRRHSGFAFNLAARIAGSTSDVEDVVHDSFLRAFDEFGSLRNPAAFRSWLGSIVVHNMRSRLRRGRWLRFFGLGRAGDPIDIESIASDAASPRVRAELAQIYALLQTLSPDERIAWTLRCVEGHDLETTARLTGCSLATVKRRIRRAQIYIEAHYVTSAGHSSRTRAPLGGDDEDTTLSEGSRRGLSETPPPRGAPLPKEGNQSSDREAAS